MLSLGLFRVFMRALIGVLAVTLLPQYTSGAAVLKNACPPNDYLCNHIYQLKLETHGLISELERRFPDMVNGEQYRGERRSDVGISGVEDGSIHKLDEVSMKPRELSEDISKVPLGSKGTTAEPREASLSISQTPPTPGKRNNTIPSDPKTASTPVSDKTEQEVETSATQSNHRINSTSALLPGDLVTNSSQHETSHGTSTIAVLTGQSTTKPVPRSSPDADDSQSQVVFDSETSTKPATSVTDETTSRGTPSVSPITEEDNASHVSKVSTSKPVHVTIGHIDINGGSQFITDGIETTKSPSVLSTDAKHSSSTPASAMIAHSTAKAVALDEDMSSQIPGSESTTEGQKTTFGIRAGTTSSKSTLKAEVGDKSTPLEEHTLTTRSSTTGETKTKADSDRTTRAKTSLRHASSSTESPIPVTNNDQFTSANMQRETSPFHFSTTTRREQEEEEHESTTTKPLGVMGASSKKPVPSTDTLHQTTRSPMSLTTVPADRSTTSASRVAGTDTTVKVTSRGATETEFTSGSGDAFLVSPTDVSESSTARVSSTSTQARATHSVENFASRPVSENANYTTDFAGNKTVIEGKWTAHYNTETLTTEIPYTEIVTEDIELTTLPEIPSSVNIRDATTRRSLETSRRTVTTQSPSAPQSRQTQEVTIQPEDTSTRSPETASLETDVTILEDESEVIFVTSINEIIDTYVTTEKDVKPSKVLTTETIEETEVMEEIFVTDEIDVTTKLYDETDKYFLFDQDMITKRDATTEKSVVTDKDVPSTKHHTTEQDVTTRKYDTTEKHVTTEEAVTTFGSTTELDRTTHVPTTTVPTTTHEPTTPTPAPPKDCDEIWRRGYRESGIFTIFPNAYPGGFQVFCDLQDVDGGWTVIQRRVNGSVNFYRPWFDYFLGFGTLQREFYLGNEKIHRLTNQKKYELSILLWDFEGESRYARYQVFRLGDYMSDYELSVRGYTGNAGNSLGYHSRGRFSTFDRDSDDNSAENCALMYGSGWWFKDCNAKSNLNGHYLRGENTQRGRGITWKKWKGLEYSLRYSEMRIKPNGL